MHLPSVISMSNNIFASKGPKRSQDTSSAALQCIVPTYPSIQVPWFGVNKWNFQSLQRASTAKLFSTPGQGSPKVAVEMGIEHPSWPRQACKPIEIKSRLSYKKTSCFFKGHSSLRTSNSKLNQNLGYWFHIII